MKILFWYLYQMCANNIGSRRGVHAAHWDFLTTDMEKRYIIDVILNLFLTWNIRYPVSFGLILCRPCQPPLQPHISPPNHGVFSWNFQWAKRHKWHINITQHHIPKGSWPIMSIVPKFTQLFDKNIRIILSDRKKVKRPIIFSYGKSINWASGINWCTKYFSISDEVR